MRPVVVTGYVPLKVKHLSAGQFHDLADQWITKVPVEKFIGYPVESCWLYQVLEQRGWLHLPPATVAPSDRFETPREMVLSNIVMHQRTTFMCDAARLNPEADVLVWVDYGITKQGEFTGNPVTGDHVAELVQRLKRAEKFDDIPFPGIWPKGPVNPHGDNWRFCGSVLVIPLKWLWLVNEMYKFEVIKFIMQHRCVPLDVPIWALVEMNTELPFRQYLANHDATQFTAFPYGG